MRRNKLNSTVKVNVVRGFDGSTGELVETIERTATRHTGKGSKSGGRGRANPYRTISYKGGKHKLFSLPACYGELAGFCITID